MPARLDGDEAARRIGDVVRGSHHRLARRGWGAWLGIGLRRLGAGSPGGLLRASSVIATFLVAA